MALLHEIYDCFKVKANTTTHRKFKADAGRSRLRLNLHNDVVRCVSSSAASVQCHLAADAVTCGMGRWASRDAQHQHRSSRVLSELLAAERCFTTSPSPSSLYVYSNS